MNANQVLVLSPVEVQSFIELTVKQTIEKVIQEFQLQTSEPQKEILNVSEAAEFLGLAKPTIYSLTSKGVIPHFKRGKKLYFKHSVLMDWIDKGKCKTKAEIDASAEAYVKRNPVKR
jgi:excisionase family DNA binding protein